MHPQHRKALPLKAAERHQLRKRSFDASARLYHKFRPGYPEALFEDLVQLSGIPAGGRILEIGPGTGQATLPLARRGFSVLGLELGASMARLCRRNLAAFPNVRILNTAFEDWKPEGHDRGGDMTQLPSIGIVSQAAHADEKGDSPRPSGLGRNPVRSPFSYDLVLSATAFHWIPARLAYPRCARALKPHGSLALLWNFPETPQTSFYHDLREIYRRIVPRMRPSLPPELRIERQRKKIVNSGLFGPVTVLRYPWQREYDADSYIGLLKTMSDHAILAPAARRPLFRAIRRLIDDNGGSFTRPVVAVLFLAAKRNDMI